MKCPSCCLEGSTKRTIKYDYKKIDTFNNLMLVQDSKPCWVHIDFLLKYAAISLQKDKSDNTKDQMSTTSARLCESGVITRQ